MKLDLDLDQANTMPEPTSYDPASKFYPTVHLSLKEAEIPASGEITFKFRRVEKTETERNGVERCSYTLELTKLTECCCCEDEPRKSPSRESEDALDALMKAHPYK